MRNSIKITFVLLLVSIFTQAQTYNFQSSVAIEVGNDEDKAVNFEYFFDQSNQEVSCMKLDPSQMEGAEQAKGTMYMVFTKNSSTMLADMMGMKMKQTVPNNMLKNYDNSKYTQDISEIKKTGKTKVILGYTCEEYIATSDDATAHIWTTTQSFPIKASSIPLLGMSKLNTKITGFVLAMEFTSQEGDGYIKVTKIDENASLSIDSSLYSSMFGN